MVPRPEYKKEGHQTVYAVVPNEIKGLLGDIAYSLDMNEREAVTHLIRYFYEKEKVKPRPARSRAKR